MMKEERVARAGRFFFPPHPRLRLPLASHFFSKKKKRKSSQLFFWLSLLLSKRLQGSFPINLHLLRASRVA
jgi:hypothetical protein